MKLSTPITAHGETRHELTFREPKGADLVKCGIPFAVAVTAKGLRIEPDAETVAAWIADLAGIPPSAVATLSFVDMAAAMGQVVGFFVAAIPALSGMITSLSENGGET